MMIVTDEISQKYVIALQSKYKYQMDEALANLNLYLSNRLSAIGEHSSLLDEHDKWLDIYATAKGKLEALNDNYSYKIVNKI